MKFGRLVYAYSGKTYVDNSAIYNIGDNIQTFAIDNIYAKMKIPKEEIININFTDIKNYQGDYVIVPIAGYGSHYKRFDMFPISPKIIPLFVSFEMSDMTCDDIIPFLLKYQPIGCRDEATMVLLRKKGVAAYLSGCLTITLPKRKSIPIKDKVFFVDISEKLKPFIPEELKKNCEFISHEGTVTHSPVSEAERLKIELHTKKILKKYNEEATLIVTSRLHAASPCIALGIPVICAIDNIDERFSWIDKLIPIYDLENYGSIDWHPSSIEIEDLKISIINMVIKRLLYLKEWKEDIYDISLFWEKRTPSNYNLRLKNKLKTLFSKFNRDYKIKYIIWGAGVHGKLAYSLVQEYFTNARPIFVDNYMDGKLFGCDIIKPQNVVDIDFDYALITTHLGRFEAIKILEQMGKKQTNDWCYFISKDVPEEKE